ncbi:MAG: TonB-dependent siderophore receptor [Gammaproteobacteria bacterium]|nr:MAG: TonB-dependent siderophore receptor [Gammaproteobacteria bacterium]
MAQERVSSEQQQQFDLTIPAQAVSSALNALSVASRSQVSADSNAISGLTSNAINGRYSVSEALDLILQDSGLVISQVANNSYTVVAAQESTVIEFLAPLEVEGTYVENDRLDTSTGLGLTLRETPQSVSVMTAQRIKDQGLDTIKDVVNNSIALSTIEYDNVRHTIMSRGFELDSYQVDGVPLAWSLAGDSGETIADTSIYESIEVVRGATGLMTGMGNPSASINLVRKHADSEEFEGFINTGLGRWKNRWVTADLASGLNESGTIRGRFVAKYEEAESFIDLYEDQKTVFYGVLEADITDNTLLRLGASQQKNTPTSPAWGALPNWYADGSQADWSRSKTAAADWTKWDTSSTNYFANVEHIFDNGWQLMANFNHLKYTQETKILYLSGALNQNTGLGLNAGSYRSDGVTKQNSFDIKLKGDFSWFGQDHDFAIGALHSVQTSDSRAFTYDYAAAIAYNYNTWNGSYPEPVWTNPTKASDLETEQTGFYGVSRFVLTDSLNLVLGGRVAKWQRKDLLSSTEYGDSGVFIPYAGILYDLTAQHRLYASYTEIFKPQNARNRYGNYLDPLTGKSHEIGLKSSYFDDALHTSFAVFFIEQDNLAQTDAGYFIPGTVTAASKTVQGTESKGFELEVVGEPILGWNVGAGYSQFKAEDNMGNDVNTDHPRKQLKLFTTYKFSNSLQGLVVGGGVNWQDGSYSLSYNSGTAQNEAFKQKSYSLVNLMARYAVNKNVSLQLNIDNLFDETYYTKIGDFGQYRYGKPRNFSLGANYTF